MSTHKGTAALAAAQGAYFNSWGKVLKPCVYEEIEGPLVFIEGPISGARDYHSWVINLIRGKNHSINIASPRSDPGTPDMGLAASDWEHHFIKIALGHGVIFVCLMLPNRLSFSEWLKVLCTMSISRPYAQTTRFELGEAVTFHRVMAEQGIQVNVVVYFEEKEVTLFGLPLFKRRFPNSHYLEHTIRKKAPGVHIYKNLEEACFKVVELCEDLSQKGK